MTDTEPQPQASPLDDLMARLLQLAADGDEAAARRFLRLRVLRIRSWEQFTGHSRRRALARLRSEQR